jgi:dTDP-glucose 4,6-dehydratase
VVSGGAGFIGSHLCEALLDRGADVLVLDNLITGSESNLEGIASRSGFDFRKHDVSLPVKVDGPVDYVLHMASPASPRDFPTYPIQIVKVGTLGTHNMLGVALASGARFLLASTSEVYGDPLVHPQPEAYWGNVNPLGPRGCYDEAKRCAEAFTMAYNRAHNLDTRIVRIFNTYGPRMRLDDGRVIANFMSQALRRQPMTVYGDGSQTRSLCYVDDLVAGILAVLDSSDPLPFNLGSEQEVTVLELAREVAGLAGSEAGVSHEPLPQDDPRQRRPDLTRASSILGWEAKVGLRDGLQRTLEYFRRQL